MRRWVLVVVLLWGLVGCDDAADDCDQKRCLQFYGGGNYCENYCP